jgi:predicted HTH transcriptional regulator
MSDLFDWRERYPDAPGTKERRLNGASQKAAEKVKPQAAKRREQVFRYIEEHGPCTADEVAEALSIDVLSCRPRTSELVRLGRLIPTDERRPNRRTGLLATVWRAAP